MVSRACLVKGSVVDVGEGVCCDRELLSFTSSRWEVLAEVLCGFNSARVLAQLIVFKSSMRTAGHLSSALPARWEACPESRWLGVGK